MSNCRHIAPIQTVVCFTVTSPEGLKLVELPEERHISLLHSTDSDRFPSYLLLSLSSQCTPCFPLIFLCACCMLKSIRLYAVTLEFTPRHPCQVTILNLHFFWPSSKSFFLHNFSTNSGNTSILHQPYGSSIFLSAGQILLSDAFVDFTCSNKNLKYQSSAHIDSHEQNWKTHIHP